MTSKRHKIAKKQQNTTKHQNTSNNQIAAKSALPVGSSSTVGKGFLPVGEGSGVKEALVEGLVNELPGDSLMIDDQSTDQFKAGFHLFIS